MEKRPQKQNSRLILAYVLIALGSFWLLRKIGFHIEFPTLFWQHIIHPFRQFFQGWGDFLFSLQMVLILVGLILLAGKRSTGIVLIVIGTVFILPKIFLLPGLGLSFLFPVLLVAIGVAIVTKRI